MGTKTGPEKGYSMSELARMMGVDRRTLASRLEGGAPLKSAAREKRYRLSDAVQGFIAQPLQGQEAAGLSEARGRKLGAEAELAELKLGRESGELVKARNVATRVINIFRAWRLRLAVQLPREISQQLYRAESAEHVADILRREVDRMLNEFRADHLGFIQATEGMEGRLLDEEA